MSRSRMVGVTVAALVTAGASGWATGAQAASTAATGRCAPSVTRLPDLGYGGTALAFNAHEIVGGVLTEDGGELPAVWRGGSLTVLHLPGVPSGEAKDVDARGDIIGVRENLSQAWELTPSGALTLLAKSPGASGAYSTFARHLNDRGEIVGDGGNGLSSAVHWRSATSAPVTFPVAAGDTHSFAEGINEAGDVAGATEDADFDPRPAIWAPGGRPTVLQSGFGAHQYGDLFEINASDQTVGESLRITSQGVTADIATVWSASGTPKRLGALPGTNASTAYGLSDTGDVAGAAAEVDFSSGDAGPSHAFVWPGHGPLLTLPIPGLAYADSDSSVTQIDDTGTVVGTAGPADGVDSAYVWTCAFSQAYVPDAPATAPSHARGSSTGLTARSWTARRDRTTTESTGA